MRKHVHILMTFVILTVLFSSPSLAKVWNWEDGTLGNWVSRVDFGSEADTSSLTNSTDKAFEGTHSLQWHINGAKADKYWYVCGLEPNLNPGEIVYYHVWVASGAQINGLKTYLKDNNGNWVDGNWYGYTGLQMNAWNELQIQIPQDGEFPMQEVGLQVNSTVETADITVYIDYVISGMPNPPTGLTAQPLSLSEILLNWDDNTEENLSHYKIYRDTNPDFAIGTDSYIDSSLVSEFTDTGLEAYTQYYYKITAVDTDGDESPPSAQVSAKTSQPNSPPVVDIASMYDSVPLYEKFEAVLDLNDADYLNPYDPDEIDITAVFTAPSGTTWNVFGFYDDYNGVGKWKIRFSPNETGQWSFTIQATDKDGTGTSDAYQFDAVESDHHGWVHVSEDNPHYMQHDDGSSFYGTGVYIAWSLTEDRLDQINDVDANMYAMWNITYGGYISSYGVIENELGRYNQAKCGRIDEMLEMSEARGLGVMFCFWPHDLFSETVWATQWSINPYSTICDAKNVYSDSTCWEYQKKQYRYLIARFGYSRSLLIWEIINEINGTDGWTNASHTTAMNWVGKVNEYFQNNDPYDHPTTASKSGGYTEYEAALYDKSDLPNIHFYEYQGWPIKSNQSLFWSSSRNFAYAAYRFWQNFEKPAIIGEADVLEQLQDPPEASISYHNAIWTCLTNGLSMTPVWWKLDEMVQSELDELPAFKNFVSGINFINESKEHFRAYSGNYDLYGMHGDSTAFGWLLDRYETQVIGDFISFEDVLQNPDKLYKIDYYNTWTGEWASSRIAPSSGDNIYNRVPAFTDTIADVAFKVSPAHYGGGEVAAIQLCATIETMQTIQSSNTQIYCYAVNTNGNLLDLSEGTVSFELTGPGVLENSSADFANGIAAAGFHVSDVAGTAKIVATFNDMVSDTIAIEIEYPADVADNANNALPRTTRLARNYPNPFNPSTHIQYDLAVPGLVNITVFNTNGQQVAVLENATQAAGSYNLTWDASDVVSGVYFIRMQTAGETQTQKCLLLK